MIKILKTFKTVFDTLSALRACQITIRWDSEQEIHNFRGLSSEFCDFWYLFMKHIDSNILSSSCCRHQKFNHKCSNYARDKAQSPYFGHSRPFWHLWGAHHHHYYIFCKSNRSLKIFFMNVWNIGILFSLYLAVDRKRSGLRYSCRSSLTSYFGLSMITFILTLLWWHHICKGLKSYRSTLFSMKLPNSFMVPARGIYSTA